MPGLPQRPLVYTPVAAPAEEVAKLKVSHNIGRPLDSLGGNVDLSDCGNDYINAIGAVFWHLWIADKK